MAKQNPPWVWDEDILALDLYFRWPPSRISEEHVEVVKLSALLQLLPIHALSSRADNFRNPNGVHMKMMNFLFIDPSLPGGLPGGGAMASAVWKEFAHDRPRLESIAAAIRAAVQPSAVVPLVQVDTTADDDVPEGAILLQLHRERERNKDLVRRKKQTTIERHGKLACEICNFDYSETYGALGEGFIECHHLVPLSASAPDRRTRLHDLALVCGNCHRMLHRGKSMMDIAALRDLIARNRQSQIPAESASTST